MVRKVSILIPRSFWRQYFESQGIQTLAINSKEQVTVKVVTDAAKKLMADKIARHGRQSRTSADYPLHVRRHGRCRIWRPLLADFRHHHPLFYLFLNLLSMPGW